jgi:hypothetical protein
MSAPADAHPGAAPAPAPHADVDPAAGLDASAALLRAESAHLDATLHALARQLAAVPGLALAVSHRQGRLRRLLGDLPYLNDLHRARAAIETLALRAGAHSYTLRAAHGSLTCTREQLSPEGARGAREELPFTQWAAALFADIEHQNLANHEALRTLRELIERGAAQ